MAEAVLDRELSRIGAPVAGAHSVGPPYTSAGSAVCVDECLVRTQSNPASGQVGALAREAIARLKQRDTVDFRRPQTCRCLSGEQPPVFRVGYYEIDCSASGHTSRFMATVTFQLHGSVPFVPMPSGAFGEYRVPVPPPGLQSTLRNGVILIDVTNTSNPG